MTFKINRVSSRFPKLMAVLAGPVSLLGLAFFTLPIHAQEKGINSMLEEVTVTARKREEGLQDTPIAVSAFSGESLAARGIERIDSLDSITPNMDFRNINVNGGGGSNASVYIRGVGQTDFVPSADPGVGIYVDGVYYARSIGSVLDLIDIDRVEVLRGPQGTLFGRNTTGGAVAIHSQKPHEEFELKARGKVGRYDRMDLTVKINGALTDNLFASAVFGTFNRDGYVVNPDTGLDTGDDETMAFRGAIRWLVSDSLEININGDYTRDRENGQATVSTRDPNLAVLLTPGSGGAVHNINGGASSPFNIANAPAVVPWLGAPFNFPPFLSGGGFTRQFTNCDATPANPAGTTSGCANASTVGLGANNGTSPNFYDADIWGVSGTIDWQVNDNISVKSITAYRDLDSDFAHDGDNSPFFLSWVRDMYEQSQFSQEIQVQGRAFDDRLQWILGGYYFEEDGLNYNPVDFAAVDIESGGFFDHSSIAGFAQATFDITEKLHLTAGIRYTEDEKDFIVRSFTYNGHPWITTPGTVIALQTAQPVYVPPPGPPFFGPPSPLPLVVPDTYTLKANDWTPMVNISYDWDDELMAYFTFSEGFKSGGVQQRIAGPVGFAPTYDPEFVESYELGFKYNSVDGKFVMNGAIFYADYTDIQLETIDPNGGIAPQLENSGVGEIKGFELEVRWSPYESWFTEIALGHLDAKITESDPDAIAAGGPSAGDRLPFVARWSLGASIIKEFGLGDMGVLTPRVDYSYKTKTFFSPDNNPRNAQKSFGLLNASVGWRSADDKYGLNFYVDNIFDTRYIHYTDQSPSSSTQNDFLGIDRIWYLTGEVSFF